MFSLGGPELAVIVILALLLFGPDKIPQMARTVGRFMREFNKYKDIMESTVRDEIFRAEVTSDAPQPTVEERINRAAAAADEVIAEREAAAGVGAGFMATDEGDEEDEE